MKTNFCPGSGGWSAPKPNSKAIEGLPPVQLYNIKEDVAEKVNLQAQYPERVEEFRRILSGYVKEGRSTKGAPQKNDDPQTWAQLKWMNE